MVEVDDGNGGVRWMVDGVGGAGSLKNRKFEWPNSPSQPTSDGFKELSLKPGTPGDGFGSGWNCVSDLNSIFCNRTFEV